MNSKRSTLASTRVLIDSCFLLPAVGLDVEEEVYDAIKHFHKVAVCYIEASMLEIVWKIVKLIPESGMNIVRIGIEAVRNTYTLITPGAVALSEAYSLYNEVHKDLIDNLLYAVSFEEKIPLLTIDRGFIQALKLHGRDTSNIMVPETFVKAFK